MMMIKENWGPRAEAMHNAVRLKWDQNKIRLWGRSFFSELHVRFNYIYRYVCIYRENSSGD